MESVLADVTQGVPQGSYLGPLLYIMYVNNCFDVLIKDNISTILMYADDTVLLTCGENVESVMESNKIFFNRYVEWTTRNGLKINVSKTKHMTLCTKSINNCVDMNIHIIWLHS